MNDFKDLTILTNTHSSCRDIWPLYFGQLEKHWPETPKHLMIVNECGPITFGLGHPQTVIQYDNNASFSTQYLQGLEAVDTEFVLTMLEDYVLYDDVDMETMGTVFDGMRNNTNTSAFTRLIYSGVGRAPGAPPPHLYRKSDIQYPYSMQATIWRTEALITLYSRMEARDPWEAEMQGCKICHHPGGSNFEGSILYDGGEKRGRDHWDSKCFPYMSTALVRGKWNHEYAKELMPLLRQYDIDINDRGMTNLDVFAKEFAHYSPHSEEASDRFTAEIARPHIVAEENKILQQRIKTAEMEKNAAKVARCSSTGEPMSTTQVAGGQPHHAPMDSVAEWEYYQKPEGMEAFRRTASQILRDCTPKPGPMAKHVSQSHVSSVKKIKSITNRSHVDVHFEGPEGPDCWNHYVRYSARSWSQYMGSSLEYLTGPESMIDEITELEEVYQAYLANHPLPSVADVVDKQIEEYLNWDEGDD